MKGEIWSHSRFDRCHLLLCQNLQLQVPESIPVLT